MYRVEQHRFDAETGRQLVGPFVKLTDAEAATESSAFGLYDRPTRSALAALARYVRALQAAHPDLGRSGAVCPFVSGAISRGMLVFTALNPAAEGGIEVPAIASAVDALRAIFPPMRDLDDFGNDEIFRSVMILCGGMFDGIDVETIERVQKLLKPLFVSSALMIGEFYPRCPAPGVHNAAFRPLDAPLRALAIRRLTVFDAPFVADDPDCRASYLRYFGRAGRHRIDRVLAAREARDGHFQFSGAPEIS